jgi:membrane fusion protein, multidrug efflux system
MKNPMDSNSWFRGLLGGKTLAIVALLAVAVGGAIVWRSQAPAADSAGGRGPGGMGGNRAQAVSAAEVRVADVPIWISALGTATPRNLVTVRTRVDGELMKLHFREGQMVTQGQLLAEIDPRPYQVQLTQANGQFEKDAAQLKNAELDLERYKDLWAKDSIAKQQLDTQEALVRQYSGTVESDRGQVDNAKLQLAYARVVAPASGRIGLRQVDPGNQVHASDANGLAVIAQLQPMTVVFAVPETHLPALNRRLAGDMPIAVEAWDREQKTRLASGRLLTIDNLVDTATGTVKMKAEFANQDNALFPNQFTNVRLLLGTRRDSIVVPSASVLRGSKGAFVYVVDADNAVTSVLVTPGPADGTTIAVDGPLKPGVRVVTDGADNLRDGAKVEVIAPDQRPAASGEQKAGIRGGGRRNPGGQGGGSPTGPGGTGGGSPPAAN